MEALVDRWERRLVNWALWEVSGAAHQLTVGSYDRQWWDSPPRPPLPLVGDAFDVEHLLARLHSLDPAGRLQHQAVRIRYVWTGSEILKAQQSNIPARTLRDRVFVAKHRLDDLEQRERRQITRCISAESRVFAANLPMLSR